MAEKDIASMAHESMRPPPGPPPHNEGRTVAAWTTTWVVVAGALIACLGLVLTLTWLFWVGLGVAVLGLVVGKAMSLAGLGQPSGRPGRPGGS